MNLDCPKCKHEYTPSNWEEYPIQEAIETQCPKCEYEFEYEWQPIVEFTILKPKQQESGNII